MTTAVTAVRLMVLAPVLPLLLLAATPAAAQVITGRLLDQETDAGIESADVLLLDAGGRALRRVSTSADGSFIVRAPAPARYRLQARGIGYSTATSAPLDLVRADSLDIEFRIAVAAVPVAPITVVGRRGTLLDPHPRLAFHRFYEREELYGQKMGFGHFLSGEELRGSAMDVTDLLRDVPGIRVEAAGGREIVVRGRGGCGRRPITFYLDGVRLGRGELPDAWIPASAVVGIEAYPGEVGSAEYGKCAVLVWTGPRR